ncbi:MAG TPA: hypothetical protein VMM37_04030 [Bacteroidota bacterium]|nr:hypothetical protein [Bacteroidota bacterium]
MSIFADARDYLLNLRDRQRMTIALTRGSIALGSRHVDLTKPETWEFSGFSQNGEDGILHVLRGQLTKSNRTFIEIGIEDGVECNSAWLIVAEKYSGVLVEGNPRFAARARRLLARQSTGVECLTMFVTKENVQRLKGAALYGDPDVFSLDIDGNDYYVAQSILSAGFRPKIFVVEYNAVFGPSRSLTIPYRADFDYAQAHGSRLYYGVSIAGWKRFFAAQGYRFVTVDRNGVNAFFVDPSCYRRDFLKRVKGADFAENRYQLGKFRKPSDEQFRLIADLEFVTIDT